MFRAILHRLRGLRRHLRGIVWRGTILIAVIACGAFALSQGVGFSERPEAAAAGTLTKLYYLIGLFVLGGLDLGTPIGGTELGRGLLWFTYFAAPAITTLSLIEGVWLALAPERWRLRGLRNHIIIVGCGRIGRLYLKNLRRRRPHKLVLMIDIRPDHPAIVEIHDVYGAEFVAGDIRDEVLLDALALEHADRMFLVTGDDFANLEAAAKILSRWPELARRTVVHVANLHFLRIMAGTRVATACTIVNKYQIAAAQLVRTELCRIFERTEGHDIVVIAGFGRFGQTVLNQLQQTADSQFDHVVILDSEADRASAIFAQQVGFRDFYRRQIVEGDLHDPRVWNRVEGIRDAQPVFIIGCGDDGTNLSTALWVKSEFPHAHVVVRNFYQSSFAEELSRESDLLVFGIADLVASSMPEPWFGR